MDAEKGDHVLSNGGVITNVEIMPESAARLGEAVGVIDAPRERVWKVICDYNEQKNFMPKLLECFVFRSEGLELIEKANPPDLRKLESQLKQYKTDELDGDVIYIYGMGDFPWPMRDKRYILKVVRDLEDYMTHSTMLIGEMKANESSWELMPYGRDGSKTLARYRILLDPGIPVPGFALRMAVNSTLPEVINAVRRRVKDARYARPREEEISPGRRLAAILKHER